MANMAVVSTGHEKSLDIWTHIQMPEQGMSSPLAAAGGQIGVTVTDAKVAQR